MGKKKESKSKLGVMEREKKSNSNSPEKLPEEESGTTLFSEFNTDEDDNETGGIGTGKEGIQTNNKEKETVPMKLFPIFSKKFKPSSNSNHQTQLSDVIESLAKKGSGGGTQKKVRKSLLRKDPGGFVQTTIDAGQKEIGPRLCIDCGLLYSPGAFEDEEEHRKAHLRLENVFTITLWKDVNLLQNFTDGGFVIMVQKDKDSKKILNRLKDFMGWLDSELGIGLESPRCSSERIFIYASSTKRKNVVRVLGCATMEVITPDKISIFTSESSQSNSSRSPLKSEKENQKIDNNKSICPLLVGITRLWTDPNFRKRQIASRLCDTIRFNCGIPGCIVPKAKLGILEPSTNGKAFMNRYTGGSCTVYSYR